ncbi:MAG: sugar phosphate isomerase/epimerase [Fuerstiella sp.]|nr:sugar phosphate isomerase/epimerase [Fuerstiella sp.]
MSLEELASLAVDAGYDAVCMRASQIGVQSSEDQVTATRRVLDDRGLAVSMVTGDFDIVYNNEHGPNCLREITPYLDLAEALGAPLLRVCLKQPEDIPCAQAAADEAAERGLTLVHQCHTLSLFETLDGMVETLKKINHSNFGLIFEAANLEGCRQEYGLEAVQRVAPWIRNVYLQNQQLNSEGAVTLNTWCAGPVSFDITQIHEPGGIDFESVFDGLKAIGYDGPVTVHQSGPEDGKTSPVAAATQTAAYLRELWN